jgi:glycosyltransferase involved in cell wall biosynthesis
MYGFAPEENYHLHALKAAKELGFKTIALVKGSKENMEKDPNFDPDILVIDYKNVFHFFFRIVQFSLQGSLFYVNSYEWQSFVVPFLAWRTIFMAHTQPKRQTKLKQHIQNFVYQFFSALRLNNEEEKEFLIGQGTNPKKLHVVPLIVSTNTFKLEENNFTQSERKDLVYFGNITAKKDLPTIVRAFELVKQTYPDIKLNIIGNMCDENTTKMIRKSPFKKDILLYGFMPNEKLVPELNKKLIYLNSSFDEGQCVAVYDAALCGCALCLPNIMSFTGVFKNTALFHNVGDHKKLAQNIIQYISDPKLMQKNREKNISSIKEGYSIGPIDAKLKELFSRVARHDS